MMASSSDIPDQQGLAQETPGKGLKQGSILPFLLHTSTTNSNIKPTQKVKNDKNSIKIIVTPHQNNLNMHPAQNLITNKTRISSKQCNAFPKNSSNVLLNQQAIISYFTKTRPTQTPTGSSSLIIYSAPLSSSTDSSHIPRPTYISSIPFCQFTV